MSERSCCGYICAWRRRLFELLHFKSTRSAGYVRLRLRYGLVYCKLDYFCRNRVPSTIYCQSRIHYGSASLYTKEGQATWASMAGRCCWVERTIFFVHENAPSICPSAGCSVSLCLLHSFSALLLLGLIKLKSPPTWYIRYQKKNEPAAPHPSPWRKV